MLLTDDSFIVCPCVCVTFTCLSINRSYSCLFNYLSDRRISSVSHIPYITRCVSTELLHLSAGTSHASKWSGNSDFIIVCGRFVSKPLFTYVVLENPCHIHLCKLLNDCYRGIFIQFSGGSKEGPRAPQPPPPPPKKKFFSISCRFWEQFGIIVCWSPPPEGLALHSYREPWIRPCS